MKLGLKNVCVLVFVLAASGFLLNRFALQLHAQSPQRTNTPEEATREFLSYLASSSRPSESDAMITRVPNPPIIEDRPVTPDTDVLRDSLHAVIAHKSFEQLEDRGVQRLLKAMLAKTLDWRVTGSFPAADQGSATVQVAPNFQSVYAVVCVREGGVWRVDLVETFGKWLGLDEQKKQQRIYDITDVALSDLAYGEEGSSRQCQRNLKQLALGVQQYLQDYDELYPPARQWSDALVPYLKNGKLFHCPATKNYGYAMNWKLSIQNESSVNYSATTVMIYESLTQRRNHSGEGKGLAYRHDNGLNIAFADGHVKWFERNAKEKWPNVHWPLFPR